jgi:hypothetical protein
MFSEKQGRYEEAKAQLDRAVNIWETTTDCPDSAVCFNSMGEVLRLLVSSLPFFFLFVATVKHEILLF